MVTCNAPSLALSTAWEPYLLKAEATVAMAYFIDAPLPSPSFAVWFALTILVWY